MSLYDFIIARAGTTSFSGSGVSKTDEFNRIKALPRRNWKKAEDLKELVPLLSKALQTKKGTMQLWEVQAAALREIHDINGCFLPVAVGAGKSIISLLAPIVLKAEAPVLFVPASLREQTNLKIIPEMKKHWKLPKNLKIFGYSELSLAKNAKMLDEISPDLIILDECHSVKSTRAGRTKRLVRYLRKNPQTKVVAMSGTVANRSIKDYWHILRWCLKDDLCPLPIRWREMQDWSDAIDEGTIGAGILKEFCADGERLRQGYRRRLVETPGVIATSENELGCALRIAPLKLSMPKIIETKLDILREKWEAPNGDIIAEASDLWRYARELALGFWYEWVPAPPKEWMEARRDWKKYVRQTLASNRRNLDTELQVWNDCKFSEDPNPEWVYWKNIKDIYKPNVKAQWISDFAIKAVAKWLNKNEGICWIEHRAFGEKLQQLGFKYYGAGKKASAEILEAKGPIVASIRAHGQGKNLQSWDKNLMVSPPSSGKTWEQCLGRTHRFGQKSDEVCFDVFVHAPELVASFKRAIEDASYLEDTLGSRQKLNYADISVHL